MTDAPHESDSPRRATAGEDPDVARTAHRAAWDDGLAASPDPADETPRAANRANWDAAHDGPGAGPRHSTSINEDAVSQWSSTRPPRAEGDDAGAAAGSTAAATNPPVNQGDVPTVVQPAVTAAPAPGTAAPQTAAPAAPGAPSSSAAPAPTPAPTPTGHIGIADADLVAKTSLQAVRWLSSWLLSFGAANAIMALLCGYLGSPLRWIVPTIIGAAGVVMLVQWALKHRATVMRFRSATAGFWLGWLVIWGVMCWLGFAGHRWAWWAGAIALAGLGFGIAANLRRRAAADVASDFRTH